MRYVVLALAFALTGACYSPQYRDCQFACTQNQCPDGLECTGGMCRPHGMTGPCPAETVIDAAADSRSDLTIAELAEAQLDALCAYFVRCGSFEDVPTCRSVLAGNLGGSYANVEAAVTAGKIVYHPDRGAACTLRFDSLSCDRNVAFTPEATGLDCALTFTGSGTAGQVCGLNEECVSGICTIPNCPNACCQGTCSGSAAPAIKNPLESCTSRDVCSNSFCNFNPNSFCEPFKAMDATCTRTSECATGLFCKTVGSTSTCQPLVATNGPCTTSSECKSLGDVCTGGACATGGLTSFACSSTDGCQQFHQCLPATGCDLPPDVGESCQSYSSCRTGYCDQLTQTCTNKKLDGANCDPARAGTECTSGYCDNATANPVCATRPICT